MEHRHHLSQPSTLTAHRRRATWAAPGFSLIEVTVSVAIIAIISTIVVGAVGVGKRHALLATETAAMRALISSYLMTPSDNGGKLVQAEKTGGQYRERWSEIMTSYFNDGYKNSLYINDQVPLHDGIQRHRGGDRYILSMYGSFGMNHRFVGGNYNSFGTLMDQDVVTHPSDAERPGSLIVFTSSIAQIRPSGLGLPPTAVNAAGYYKVYAPSSGWSSRNVLSDETEVSNRYGSVAFRHKGKAVVAFLDGSVRAMEIRDMRDMRLWSNGARLSNQYDYAPPIAE